MTQNSRLDSVAPSVAERFRRAPSLKRRRAVLIACEHAVATVGLTTADAGVALDVLRGATSSDPDLGHRLARSADEYDDEYFRLSEGDEPHHKHEAIRYFSMARAISALVFALSPNDDGLHEAMYEAIAALDDPTDMTRLIEWALQ